MALGFRQAYRGRGDGTSLNDSQMQRIKEFYWWLQEKHAMTAFDFTRRRLRP